MHLLAGSGPAQRALRIVASVAAPVLVITACGATATDPGTLLRQAKATVDAAKSVHFQLTSTNVQGAGPLISGGEGDARRPSGFAGTLDVSVAGLSLGIQVVSYGGTFYVKLPTESGFSATDPTRYGFGDPAKLLDPNSGLSSLLLLCASPSLGTTDRYKSEELDEVSCSLPGAKVAALLTSADPARPVSATFGVDPGSDQLRRVLLSGPFFSRSVTSTFTLILDSYGENVTITPPPTG